MKQGYGNFFLVHKNQMSKRNQPLNPVEFEFGRISKLFKKKEKLLTETSCCSCLRPKSYFNWTQVVNNLHPIS